MVRNGKSKGVSLIALVITLIVFMIIISITVAVLTDDSGIIKQAQDSKTQADINEEYRIIKAATVSALKADNMGVITPENLKFYLDQMIDVEYTIEDEGDKIRVTFVKTDREYVILEDGEVIYDEKDDEGNHVNEDIVSIELSSSAIPRLGIEETAEIEVIITTTGETITWETSNDKVASVQVQPGDNKKAIITGISDGSCIISVKVTLSDGSIKETFCNVTVKSDKTIEISKVELDKDSATIDLESEEKTVQLIAIIYPEDANYGTNLTWTSSDSSVASVDENGKVTGLKNGTTTITVKTENGKTATCTIKVQTSPSAIRIEQDKIVIDLSTKKTEQLTPLMDQEIANVNKELTWTSSDSSVATVNSSGLVTGIKNGTAIVTIKTENDKIATCNVTVQTSPTGVTLNKTSATLDLSGTKTVQLTATVNPSTVNVSNGLTWTTSNSSVATVNTGGLVTGIKNGNATITVTTENGKTAQCNVTVQTSPTGVTLNKTSATLDLSGIKTVQLTATVNPSAVNVSNGLTWTTSNSSVATVNTGGLVTGIKNGNATITVTTANGKTAQCTITVQTSPTGVTLNKTSATLDLSGTKTVQLTATVNPSTVNVSNGLTWTSGNSSVATVNNSGLVTGIKNGNATITVKTANGKTAQCNVVVQTSITGLAINPTNAEIQPGQTVQLTATKTPTSATEGITWRSNNTSVATVNSSGVVTGQGNGTTTITVQNSSGTKSISATIRCYQKYTIAYNANNGSGAPGNQIKTHGTDISLSSTQPTRTGYTFKGWNTRADGTGTTYAAGASYRNNANLTLYAMWQQNKYTVTYNANGGSGAPASQNKNYGENITLSSTQPTRGVFTFQGWSTSATGSVVYAPGATYTNNANVTLYAIWVLNDFKYNPGYSNSGAVSAGWFTCGAEQWFGESLKITSITGSANVGVNDMWRDKYFSLALEAYNGSSWVTVWGPASSQKFTWNFGANRSFSSNISAAPNAYYTGIRCRFYQSASKDSGGSFWSNFNITVKLQK